MGVKQSHLTLSDLKRSKSRALIFWVVRYLYNIHVHTFAANIFYKAHRSGLSCVSIAFCTDLQSYTWRFRDSVHCFVVVEKKQISINNVQ